MKAISHLLSSAACILFAATLAGCAGQATDDDPLFGSSSGLPGTSGSTPGTTESGSAAAGTTMQGGAAGTAMQAAAAPGANTGPFYNQGATGQAGMADRQTMCAIHSQMMAARTPEERQALMAQHMRDMSPEMQQRHLQMMGEQCR